MGRPKKTLPPMMRFEDATEDEMAAIRQMVLERHNTMLSPEEQCRQEPSGLPSVNVNFIAEEPRK
jgi:hypothetical protein